MLATYRGILAHPGAALFSATGLVARLPISMLGLGIVLLVEDESGSYALAGTVSATALVANAVLAVVQGRYLDRLGQSRVLPLVITVWAAALAVLIVSVEADWALPVTFAAAAVCGGAMPSVGGCVRARWAHVLADPVDRQTAFALEAVADEAVFMTGPIIVTLLATAIDPALGLAAALVAGLLGTYAFSAQRGTEPPPHPRVRDDVPRPAMPWRTVVPLTVAALALGTLFGSVEVTTVAFTDEQGLKPWAGVLLALWAAGSLLAGLITGAVTWRRPLVVRMRWGSLAMTLTMIPLLAIGSVPVMAGWLLLSGFSIAPTLIAAMSLAEQAVPPARLTEGMAFLQTGLLAGVAPGASVAGLVVDAHGASAAYVVPVAGGLLALVGALLTRVSTSAAAPAAGRVAAGAGQD